MYDVNTMRILFRFSQIPITVYTSEWKKLDRFTSFYKEPDTFESKMMQTLKENMAEKRFYFVAYDAHVPIALCGCRGEEEYFVLGPFSYGLTNTFYQGRAIYPEFQHEGLSRYNKDAYNLLRADYNTDKDIVKLFVLLIYGFNHYLRFNNKDEFNVPVGKVDFVKTLRDKTRTYCNAIRNKQLHITNLDFRCEQLYIGAEQTTLFYFDPPYLITQAPYNISWTEQDERDLLNLIDGLNDNGYRFMLSNVSQSNGKRNNLLCDWMQKYNVRHIHRQYLNSSYQKKNLSAADEVVISNF